MSVSRLLKIPIALLLVVYFVYLVVSNTPAAWAAWGVHQAVPNLWLSSVNGTLWEGRARAAQVDIGPAEIPLGEVRWSLNPWSLLILRPCVKFASELPRQSISGTLCQRLGGDTVLRDVNVDAPFSVIQELTQFDASGVISLQVLDARFDANATIKRMDARFSWQNARAFTGESWIQLGDFAATAKENGEGGVLAEAFDINSPYKIALTGQWWAAQGWKIEGTVNPQSGAAPVVVEGLKVLGEDQGDGAYRIQWPL